MVFLVGGARVLSELAVVRVVLGSGVDRASGEVVSAGALSSRVVGSSPSIVGGICAVVAAGLSNTSAMVSQIHSALFNVRNGNLA